MTIVQKHIIKSIKIESEILPQVLHPFHKLFTCEQNQTHVYTTISRTKVNQFFAENYDVMKNDDLPMTSSMSFVLVFSWRDTYIFIDNTNCD